MKKYELKQDDLKRIAQIEKNDVIVRYLKHKEEFRFNVGDVLIKQVKSGYKDNEQWTSEEISHINKVPKKFLYVYENELGVGYIKQIKSDGTANGAIYPMTEFSPKYVRFVLDPDYADHLMLAEEGEAFDFHASYNAKKKFRDTAYRNNKKQLVRTESYIDQAKFAASLELGSRFWAGSSMDRMSQTLYEVVAITKMSFDVISDRNIRERMKRGIEDEPDLAKELYTTMEVKYITCHYDNYVGTTTKFDFSDVPRFVSIKPPFKMSEDI